MSPVYGVRGDAEAAGWRRCTAVNVSCCLSLLNSLSNLNVAAVTFVPSFINALIR